MLKNRLLDALKNKNTKKPDGSVSQAAAKIENQKRLSTQEILKVYETIWQEGPKVKYLNPGAKEREQQFINQNPTLY